MKLRILFTGLLFTVLSSAAFGQTVSASTVSSTVTTAQNVGRDLKAKKYKSAATTVLDNKEVKNRLKVDKDLKDKALNTNLRTEIRRAKTEFKRNPVQFAEKHKKSFRLLNKYRPKWLKRQMRLAKARK
jgi:hypothetical protein